VSDQPPKDWLLKQEPPPPDPVEGVTDPYEHMSYAIGSDDDFWCFDYHVFPDMTVQIHAVINSETGSFIMNAEDPVRLPPDDAIEYARQITDQAQDWVAENFTGDESDEIDWQDIRTQANRFVNDLGRELYQDWDEREGMTEAQRVVEALIG